jgi:hypothetical protein
MKKYEDLDEQLKLELEEIVKSDPYGLLPQTLYKNIFHSTGPITTLAEIFDVKASVVRKIKSS